MLRQLYRPKTAPMRIAAFMSGTGSNLRRILELQKQLESKGSSLFQVVMVFSDTADEEKCNARKIAEEHGIPHYCSDIRDYYNRRGADRKDMKVRKDYDRETAALLKKNKVDAVALCGYMSLVTGEICDRFLTVNVHPADLRLVDNNGKRKLGGCMGANCIEKARQLGLREARSTTHIVTTELDGGSIIMVSEAVRIGSGNDDELLEKLKEKGDWKIYPETIKRIAEGRFWIDSEENLVIDLVEEKQLIRQKMRELRDRLSDEEVRKKSSLIAARLLKQREYKDANTIMFYFGINKEVHTESAIKEALKEKKTVVVPVTDTEKGKIIPSKLEFIHQTRPGAYGIPEPAVQKKVDAREIELVIVPGLAFDEEGNRVGYGLGYFDKFLKTVAAARIGLAYEMQVTDKIRTTPEDVPMDKVITEKRAIEVKK